MRGTMYLDTSLRPSGRPGRGVCNEVQPPGLPIVPFFLYLVHALAMQSCVEITGYGYSKRLCEDVVCWFLNEHLPRYKIQLEIVHRGLKRERAHGFCDCIEYNKSKPREFLIELNTNMEKETYIRTLLHELTHLRQWAKGDLRVKRGNLFYKEEPVKDGGYWKQPHEIEAHEMEEKLYYQYQQHILNRKILPFHAKKTNTCTFSL